MVGFMLSFIVPKITGIFAQIHQELPSTKIVIALEISFQITMGMLFYFCCFYWWIYNFIEAITII